MMEGAYLLRSKSSLTVSWAAIFFGLGQVERAEYLNFSNLSVAIEL